MAVSRLVALLDACVLAGALKRNVLLSLAEAEVFQPRWSLEILNETEAAIGAILGARGDQEAPVKASLHVTAMRAAFPDASVEGHEHLVGVAQGLPDANDAHVIAAAVKARAPVIVTDNLRHFPPEALASFGLEAKSADVFIADMLDLDISRGVAALRTMRLRLKRPAFDAKALLLRFEAQGLVESTDLLRPWIEQL